MYKRRLFYILIFFTMLAMFFASNVTSSTALSVEGNSQNQTTYEKLNLIILVKASKRSNEPINGFEDHPKTKLQVIQDAVKLVFEVHQFPPNVNIGIMAYGNKIAVDYDKSCTEENVDELIPLSSVSQNVDLTPLSSISGLGNAPTTIALKEAAKKFPQNTNNNQLNAILLIADGVDDCPNQKPEDMAHLIAQEKNIVIYAIGLNANNEINAQLMAITTNPDTYSKTNNNLTANAIIVINLRDLIIGILDDLESQAPTPVVVPTMTEGVLEPTASPNSSEATSTSESIVATEVPAPTSTALIVEAPAQTQALSGLLIVAIIGLVVLLFFGYVYWNSRLRRIVVPKSEEIVEGKSSSIDEQNVTKNNQVDISSIDLDVFLQDVYENYLTIGQSGKYIPLESLKRKLAYKYQGQFDQLLILARQKYPSKIWIDKNADSQTIVKIVP